jgi:hypothetical protein
VDTAATPYNHQLSSLSNWKHIVTDPSWQKYSIANLWKT